MAVFGDEPTAEDLRDQQRKQQLHQMNLNGARQQSESGSMDRTYIREMTNYELDPGTVKILSNLLDRDFMLGNLSEAEVHEYRWLARVLRLEVEALHPGSNSILSDELRMIAFDDSDQKLPSLSQQDLTLIEQFLMAVIARATRGKDGWQQTMFNKTIQASETREVSDDDSGGFL